MAGGDKQIKFTFTVDAQSFTDLRSKVRELTSDIKSLVETMGHASSGGGGGGGGGILAGVTGRSGPVNAGRESIRVPGVGGITGGISQALVDNKNMLRGVAGDSKEALKVMSSAVKDSIGTQVKELDQLRNAYNALLNTYSKMPAALKKEGKTGVESAMMKLGADIDEKSETLAKLQDRKEDINTALAVHRARAAQPGIGDDDLAEAGLPLGVKGRLKRFMNVMRGRDPGGGVADPDAQQDSGPGFGAGVLGKASKAMGLIGAGVAAGYAIAATADKAMNIPKEMRTQSADFNLWAMMSNQRQRADVNQGYGEMAHALRTDLVSRFALSRMRQDGTVGSTVSEAKGLMKEKIVNMQTQIADGAMDTITRAVSDQAEGDSNKLGWEIAKNRNRIPMDLKNLSQERLENARKELSVQDVNYLNYLQGSFQSRLSGQAQARTTNAALLGVGTQFTAEEVGGMRAQLGAVAGGKFMGHAASILGMQAGGLSDAGNIYGAAAQFGGNPMELMRIITQASSMYGKQGLVDVAASNRVGSMVAAEMISGGGGSMNNAMGGILAATNAMGGNIQAANLMQRGNDMAKGINAGSTSPMQMALNTIQSQRIAGSLYGGQALQSLTPLEEMEIMRGGSIPSQLMAGGEASDVIQKRVSDYVNARNTSSFFGFRTGKGAGKRSDQMVNDVREHGFYETVSKALEGYTDKQAGLQSITRTLGRGQAFGRGHFGSADVKAAEAMTMLEIAKDPRLLALVTGGSVGPVGSKMDRAEKKRQDQLIVEQENRLKEIYAEHPEAFEQFSKEQLKQLGILDKVGAGNVDQAADNAAKALQTLANSIRKKEGTSPTKGNAPKPTDAPKTKKR